MKPIDIVPADLEIVRQILQDFVPEIEVRAFGSRVAWSARETSDLDLAMMTNERLPDSCSMNLREAFSESELPFKVDLIDWATTSDNFRKVIDREYVVVQGMKKGTSTNRECWIEKRFGECAILVRDTVSPSNAQKSLYIGLEHIKESALHLSGYGMASDVTSIKTRFQCGDILFGKLRPYFRKAVVAPFDGVCSTDIWVVRPAYNIDANFLFYWMASQEFVDMATQGAEGTRMPRAKWEYVSRIKKSIPPLAEQRAIAHILGALDDKIKLNRQTNETLEAIARALFKSWFVDFDPVRAKMEGHPPAGISPELAALFPDSFEDSELGEIPKGWEVKPLDKIAEFKNGLALQKLRPAAGEDRLPVVKISQLRSGRSDGDEWATANIKPECIIDNGDIVFSWSGSLMVVVWCGGRAALNQHLFKVTSEQYPKWFYLNCTQRHLESFKQIAADKATTMGHIKRHHLSDAKCIVPPFIFFEEVDEVFSELLRKNISTIAESSNLVSLRDVLLPNLIFGELRLPVTKNVKEGVGA